MSAVGSAGGRVSVGEIELTSLPDAVGLLGELSTLIPAASDWEPYRALYPELFAGSKWRLPVACHAIRAGGQAMLVDAGAGPPGRWDWEAEAVGGLPGALLDAGLELAAVDAVFFTHLHVDHIGWLDHETFANARILVHRDALAYARERSPYDWLRAELAALEDAGRIEHVAAGDEVLPGVRAVAYPGHYPGHLGLELRSGRDRALLIGDASTNPALLAERSWQFAYDDDGDLAASTRAALVEEVAGSDTLVVCGHYPGSGIGRIVRRDGRVLWEEAA